MPELHVAAYFGDLELLKERLKTDDPNLRAMVGTTALMSAFFKNQFDAYRLLIQHGADPNLVNDHGEDILSLMISHGEQTQYQWIDLLVKTGSIPHPVRHRGLLLLMMRHGRLAVFHNILRASPSMVDDVDDLGRTALHVAVLTYIAGGLTRKTMVSLLLKYGADVGRRDSNGETPRDLLDSMYHYVDRNTDIGVRYIELRKKLTDAANSQWLYAVSRVLQTKNRDAEFCAEPIHSNEEDSSKKVVQRVVCQLTPSLIQELAMMMG